MTKIFSIILQINNSKHFSPFFLSSYPLSEALSTHRYIIYRVPIQNPIFISRNHNIHDIGTYLQPVKCN